MTVAEARAHLSVLTTALAAEYPDSMKDSELWIREERRARPLPAFAGLMTVLLTMVMLPSRAFFAGRLLHLVGEKDELALVGVRKSRSSVDDPPRELQRGFSWGIRSTVSTYSLTRESGTVDWRRT